MLAALCLELTCKADQDFSRQLGGQRGTKMWCWCFKPVSEVILKYGEGELPIQGEADEDFHRMLRGTETLSLWTRRV